jgi:mannose-6-phosphate isomerase-like protein (cupin superfamily)
MDAARVTSPKSLTQHPIHLGLGATAISEPRFTGMEWYAGYVERHADDGSEARLVSMHTFHAPWESWEMHPEGSEVVLCTEGEATLIQQIDAEDVRTTLRPGDYAINEPGVWHTADASERATLVFITAGSGTEHRER